MSLFKKRLDEQEAASDFVLCMIREARDAWPTIYKNAKESFGEKFVIDDQEMAVLDLALAAIAQGLQAVKNLFPKTQSERIEKWVLRSVNTEDDLGKYAIAEVKQYGERFQQAVQSVNSGGDPVSAIPARLLHRWLGENIQNFDVKLDGRKLGVISPILLMHVSPMLTSFLQTWSWKRIKDNFKLVEGDLPSD